MIYKGTFDITGFPSFQLKASAKFMNIDWKL